MIKTEDGTATFLKENTRDEHDAVENHMGANTIFSGFFSKEKYIKLLKKLFVAHLSLEQEVLKSESIQKTLELNPEMRLSKSILIKNDLKMLHASAEAQLIDILLQNEAEAWGAYYVLEGSSLGGAVILKQLKKLEWAKDIDAFSFYGCYGSQTGPNWKLFLNVLESKDLNREGLLTGARKAYGVFLDT